MKLEKEIVERVEKIQTVYKQQAQLPEVMGCLIRHNANRTPCNLARQLPSFFLERSINYLLKQGGSFGMIIPNPWLTNILQQNTRRFVTQNAKIREVVHFLFPVFSGVTVDTEILLLEKASPKRKFRLRDHR